MLDTHIGAVDGFDNGHQKAHVQGIEIVPLVNYWQYAGTQVNTREYLYTWVIIWVNIYFQEPCRYYSNFTYVWRLLQGL